MSRGSEEAKARYGTLLRTARGRFGVTEQELEGYLQTQPDQR
jgi:hypothetical protein